MTKILIIRLSSLGDIVHTFPMVQDIKKNIPNCQIDWLVDQNFTKLVKLNSNMDNVIEIPLRSWKKNKLTMLSQAVKWKNQLKNRNYDYIIDSQGLIKSAIFVKLFKGKSHGYNRKSAKEGIASYLYDYKYKVNKNILAITKNRLLAQAIFGYDIDINKVDFGKIIINNKENQIVSPYILFFHATSRDDKKCSQEYWVNLANYMIENKGLNVVLPYGSNKEKKEAYQIRDIVKNKEKVIIPGKIYDYYEVAKLVKDANFVIGVDTGLIHLANALNKQLIAIYTTTDPKTTGVFESAIARNIKLDGSNIGLNRTVELYEQIAKEAN